MTDPLIHALFAAKGGQGTTVTAAAVALLHAQAGRRTLLVDAAEPHDTHAVLGCLQPVDLNVTATVSADLELLAVASVTELATIVTDGYDAVVIDAGTRRPAIGTATLVTRNCYLALRRALGVTPPADNAVLVAEPDRALGAVDVGAVLGIPVLATIDVDPAIARVVDAGLLATRLPAGLRRHGTMLTVPAPATARP